MQMVDEAGVVLVDKPAGLTSFAMVRVLRRLSGIKKVGHAGTLDPFATGLLVICIGRPATRLIGAMMEGKKHYLATLQLGSVSTTHDPEGEVHDTGPWPAVSAETMEAVLARFRGTTMQTPPVFSALKHQGKPLYHYARQGIVVEKPPRPVVIDELEWLDARSQVAVNDPTVQLRVRCGKGTYIRSLAADIGAALGCGAFLSGLRRLGSGCFSVEEAVSGAALAGPDGRNLLAEGLLDVEQVRKRLQYSREIYNMADCA